MLDRDPNADQPPDPSLSRSRSRSHKPKNAPKKQPQRGLGVAQLEKLRLEEQSKQQEAACLATMQHPSLHHHSHSIHLPQEQEHHYQHQNMFQHHHQSQTSPVWLPRQIKHMEPSYDKSSFAEPRFPPPFVKLNVVQNSFFPLTTLANRAQTRPLPLLIPQQQFPAEDEASTSPMSQVHDLCSPATALMRPSSAESRLSPLLTRASSASLVEKSWLNHLYDREPNIEKDFPIAGISSAQCNYNDFKLQGHDQSVTEIVNAGSASFHGENGSLHVSMGKLFMGSEGYAEQVTDSSLRSQPCVAFGAHFPSRNHSESPLVGVVSGGNRMKELSSFQTTSLCPTWSPVDKVFNRKRSWACTQELARSAEALKGVDLNTSVDEMESEVTEQDPNSTLPFMIRDDRNLLPGVSVENLSESKWKGLMPEKSCSRCLERPISDALFDGAAFLSLQEQSVNLEKWEVETPGEFLTLGPSSSSAQKTRKAPLGFGSCGTCHVSKGPQHILEQVKSSCLSSISRTANSSISRTVNSDNMSLEYQPSCLHTPLQRRAGFSDFFACNKAEALWQHSSTDESLDLELRLSI